jgi:hypothetical protein
VCSASRRRCIDSPQPSCGHRTAWNTHTLVWLGRSECRPTQSQPDGFCSAAGEACPSLLLAVANSARGTSGAADSRGRVRSRGASSAGSAEAFGHRAIRAPIMFSATRLWHMSWVSRGVRHAGHVLCDFSQSDMQMRQKVCPSRQDRGPRRTLRQIEHVRSAFTSPTNSVTSIALFCGGCLSAPQLWASRCALGGAAYTLPFDERGNP